MKVYALGCGERARPPESGHRGFNQEGAVAKLGGEPRRPSFSFPDGRCVPAFSGRLEDPVDDHRVRIGVPISKHRALTFPQ